MANSGTVNTNAYDSRYASFTWSVKSQDTANNQTTISWNYKGAGGSTSIFYKAAPFNVVIDGITAYTSTTRIDLYNGTTIASGEFTLKHDAQGNKTFTVSVNAAIYVKTINCTGEGTFTLPQIPRGATMTSAGNFNDEQNPSFTFTNPANATLSCWLEPNPNGTHYAERTLSGTSGTFTWDLTDAERDQLRACCTTSNSCPCRIGLYSTIGENTFASYIDVTMSIVNANPLMNSVEYEDTNARTTAITQSPAVIIRNNSQLAITVGNIWAYKQATLVSLTTNINGVIQTTSLSGNHATNVLVDFGTINVSSDINAVLTATDSRGNKYIYNLPITVWDWVLPTAIITCQRQNNYYTETDINVNADYSSLDGKNQITIQYQYKKTTDSSYSALANLQDDVTTTFNIDNNYQWNVRVIVTDLLGSTTYNLFVDKGIPIVFFDRLNNSTGFNCFPKNQESVEISGKTIFDMIYPIGSIYISINNTNPSTMFGGTWEQIEDAFLLAAGDTYAGGSTGGNANHKHLTCFGFDGNSIYGYADNSGLPMYGSGVYNGNRIHVGITQDSGALRIASTEEASSMPPYLAVYVWKRTA